MNSVIKIKIKILSVVTAMCFVGANAGSTYYATIDSKANIQVVTGEERIILNEAGWANYLNKKGGYQCNENEFVMIENFSYSCASKGLSVEDVDYPSDAWSVETAYKIDLYGNYLANIDFLKNLKSVENHLRVSRNLFTNVDGLSNITVIGRDLDMSYNDLLNNINGLSKVESIGNNLKLNNSPYLDSIDGLTNIVSVGGDINLSNTAIVNYTPLLNLESVGGKITINNFTGDEVFPITGAWCDNSIYLKLNRGNDVINAALLSCGANEGDYADYFWAKYLNAKGSTACNYNTNELRENSTYACGSKGMSYTDADYPDGVWSVKTISDLNLSANTFENVDFLSNIESVEKNLTLSSLNSLFKSVAGLSKLKTVGSHLYLHVNSRLSDISALSSLKSVGGSLNLMNTAVTDYSSLSNLGSVGGTISIDALNGSEVFPSSGTWCENNIYNKLPTAMISIGKASCGLQML